MTLTKLERVILINQYAIRKKLEGTDDYDDWITVLERGYSYYYDTILDSVAEGISESDCEFVMDVLQMFRCIEFYKQDLKSEELGPAARFAGFDSSSESSLWVFARFEISKDGNWDELKKYVQLHDGLNSHTEMRPRYERMIAAWDSVNGKRAFESKDDLLAVLTAARPSS